MFSLKAVILVSIITCMPAFGGLAVFDAAAFNQSVQQQLEAVKQWAVDNQNQLTQIRHLQDQLNLDLKNTLMPHLGQWQAVAQAQDEAVKLVHAAKAVFNEFGTSQRYAAAFYTSKAWQQCAQQRRCQFKQVLEYLDESGIQAANQAYLQAQDAQTKLSADLQQLKQLSAQAKNAPGTGAVLDALAKINAKTADLMVQLSSQSANMLAIHSQMQMQSRQLEAQRRSGDAQALRRQHEVKSPPFNLSIRERMP